MKKIGIISDTHGLLRPEILEILKDCDCIIHAGDVNKPEILDTLRMMGSIYVVRGNNDKDWAEGIAKTLHFTIEGVKFFMTHNKKDVDWDLKDTQVVIFGHTHKYFEKMILYDNIKIETSKVHVWREKGMERSESIYRQSKQELEDIQQKLRMIEYELGTMDLHQKSIITKSVKGKIYYYEQWRSEGKVHSR